MNVTTQPATQKRAKKSKDVIDVGIIGGAGYTGGELIRLLLNHPHTRLTAIHSRSNAGNAVASVHQDLIGETDLEFIDNNAFLNDGEIDVLFLCMGHGETKKFLEANAVAENTK